MAIKISQHFDAGAIDVVQADTPDRIDLKLRKDSHADIHQWFHFRLQGARSQPCTIRFLNAGQLPPQDAVRVEEMINYFDYQYAPPQSRETPFSGAAEGGSAAAGRGSSC